VGEAKGGKWRGELREGSWVGDGEREGWGGVICIITFFLE